MCFQASELSDKRGNPSPNTSVTQVPQKPDPTLVSPVPPSSGTATQRLGTGMLQHSMDQNSGNNGQ